jgi:beta-N-acetylhexosaminidase
LKPAILGISGPALLPEERALFREHAPRGVILFSRNIQNPAQLAELTAELREALPPGAVLMVDQEGGRVARLRPPHWPALGPAADIKNDTDARSHGAQLARMVKHAAFDVVTAPVLDLRYEGSSDVIGDRAFSADPQTVANAGWDVAEQILAAGLVPVMKHIPGHGRAKVDSHLALPRITEIDLSADFFPFQECKRIIHWAMTAHIVYEVYDPHLPATLSKTVIDRVIRGTIGFTGTLITDDLAMHALTGSPAERATAALAAGCDLALYCPGDMPGNLAILEALSKRSLF